MARRRPAAPAEPSPKVPRGTLVAVPVEGSAELWTFGPEHPLWKGAAIMFQRGSIARLDPPHGTTDRQIEDARAFLLQAGAASVRVLPRRKGAVLPAEVMERQAGPALTARQAVEQLVAESNSPDRAALAAIVEQTMASEGL